MSAAFLAWFRSICHGVGVPMNMCRTQGLRFPLSETFV